MNKTIAAAALLLLTGMTWIAEERVRVDREATIALTAHAGVTYRITATSNSSYYALQPRVVVPTLAVVDASGARMAASRIVTQTDDPKFELQTELTFTAPADGTYSIVIAADQQRVGQDVGIIREKSVATSFGGRSSVVTSHTSMNYVPVIGRSAGIVSVKVVEVAD